MCFLNKRPIFSHIFVLVRYANVYSDRNCYYTLLDIATEAPIPGFIFVQHLRGF